jgi:hypothetical protein
MTPTPVILDLAGPQWFGKLHNRIAVSNGWPNGSMGRGSVSTHTGQSCQPRPRKSRLHFAVGILPAATLVAARGTALIRGIVFSILPASRKVTDGNGSYEHQKIVRLRPC